MKFIPNAVSAKFARQALVLQKHSPAIMFGAGISTAIVATVSACKATLKVEEILERHEDNKRKVDYARKNELEGYSQSDYAKDVAKIRVQVARDLTKLYGPSVAIGVVSISLLTGAHVILTQRNAGLAAAYMVLDRSYREYRDRVKSELGEDKDREFAYGVREKEIIEEGEHGHEVKTVKRANPGGGKYSKYARFFDETNPNWNTQTPGANKFYLQSVQTYANHRLQAKGHIFLNEIYDELNFPRTKAGQVVGWVKGHGDDYIDFGIFDTLRPGVYDFMTGDGGGVWLDFNVDGPVYDLIGDTI